MRYFLGLLTAAILLSAMPALAQEPTRRILVIGGKTFSGADPDRLLMKYFLSLTGKKDPVVYYLPTASGDFPPTLISWYEQMHELDCRPRHLRLINNSSGLKNLEKRLLAADAIVVGGGNTLNMLAIWKAQGVDTIMRKAWERGVVLGGESAGMICWFEQGVTDSRPEKLTAMDCLGFLKGSACPHYNEAKRKTSYHQLLAAGEIKEGVACDDSVAILYEGERLVRAVSAVPKTRAYQVKRIDNKVVEEPLKVELLKK